MVVLREPDHEFLRVLDPTTGGVIICCSKYQAASKSFLASVFGEERADSVPIVNVTKRKLRHDSLPFLRDEFIMPKEYHRFFGLFVDFSCIIRDHLEQKGVCVVHCRNGRSRSPNVILCHFILSGMRRPFAVNWLTQAFRAQRPMMASVSAEFPNFNKFQNLTMAFEEETFTSASWIKERTAENACMLYQQRNESSCKIKVDLPSDKHVDSKTYTQTTTPSSVPRRRRKVASLALQVAPNPDVHRVGRRVRVFNPRTKAWQEGILTKKHVGGFWTVSLHNDGTDWTDTLKEHSNLLLPVFRRGTKVLVKMKSSEEDYTGVITEWDGGDKCSVRLDCDNHTYRSLPNEKFLVQYRHTGVEVLPNDLPNFMKPLIHQLQEDERRIEIEKLLASSRSQTKQIKVVSQLMNRQSPAHQKKSSRKSPVRQRKDVHKLDLAILFGLNIHLFCLNIDSAKPIHIGRATKRGDVKCKHCNKTFSVDEFVVHSGCAPNQNASSIIKCRVPALGRYAEGKTVCLGKLCGLIRKQSRKLILCKRCMRLKGKKEFHKKNTGYNSTCCECMHAVCKDTESASAPLTADLECKSSKTMKDFHSQQNEQVQKLLATSLFQLIFKDVHLFCQSTITAKPIYIGKVTKGGKIECKHCRKIFNVDEFLVHSGCAANGNALSTIKCRVPGRGSNAKGKIIYLGELCGLISKHSGELKLCKRCMQNRKRKLDHESSCEECDEIFLERSHLHSASQTLSTEKRSNLTAHVDRLVDGGFTNDSIFASSESKKCQIEMIPDRDLQVSTITNSWTKKCQNCNESKLKSHFYFDTSEPDNHVSWCKECIKCLIADRPSNQSFKFCQSKSEELDKRGQTHDCVNPDDACSSECNVLKATEDFENAINEPSKVGTCFDWMVERGNTQKKPQELTLLSKEKVLASDNSKDEEIPTLRDLQQYLVNVYSDITMSRAARILQRWKVTRDLSSSLDSSEHQTFCYEAPNGKRFLSKVHVRQYFDTLTKALEAKKRLFGTKEVEVSSSSKTYHTSGLLKDACHFPNSIEMGNSIILENKLSGTKRKLSALQNGLSSKPRQCVSFASNFWEESKSIENMYTSGALSSNMPVDFVTMHSV